MKKILITGATGFVGSHLTELCVEKGYEVDNWVEELGVTKTAAKFAPVQIKDRISLSLFIAHICLIVGLCAATYKNKTKIKIMDTTVEQIEGWFIIYTTNKHYIHSTNKRCFML